MFIDKDSIQVKINGMADYISLGDYLVEAKYGYNKLWSQDTGRNLAGTNSGTLIGIFPKIVLQIAPLTKNQVEILIPIFDAPNQSLKYYDPNKKQIITMTTYTGDYEITDKNIINGDVTNESFGISFISVRKRA